MAVAASISGASMCCLGGGSRRRCGNGVRNSFAPSTSPASKRATAASIGRQWTELQGARDWDGLLNPLDGALRGELVRYGGFVRAAYASFNSGGGGGAPSSSYGACRFPSGSLLRRAGMPGTGYGVTRLLHAASSSAPGWLSPSCGSSYIGYVAVCDDAGEIERLGRRDVVIAYRGTATAGEWVDNLQSTLTRLPPTPSDDDRLAGGGCEPPMVESGFWRLFTSPGKAHSSLQQQVRGEVQRIIREYGGEGMPPLSITVTGHSLGAALAVLTAHDIAAISASASGAGAGAPVMVTAVSFGGPRVGNAAFRRRLEESGGKVLRVVNSNDIVTKVPGFPVDDDDDGPDGGSPAPAPARKARVPRWLVAKMGWAYSDVGRELRLCSHGSATSMVASHDLDLYLKLVAACTD